MKDTAVPAEKKQNTIFVFTVDHYLWHDDGAGLISTERQMHVNVGVHLVVPYSLADSIFELNIISISFCCSSFPVQSISTNKHSVRNAWCFTVSSRVV